ncbi:nose resistant to fluoxetine protein 6 [Dermacentor silvarum]|uniref:nose resistant to fluoxetine protein 6 n=1 Tax=Dermacentor silvarum TaxID=543639 RepID=UPI00210167F0|nr:nose resistant to fluoxetine protein 6 [Dermacentor silvarum]
MSLIFQTACLVTVCVQWLTSSPLVSTEEWNQTTTVSPTTTALPKSTTRNLNADIEGAFNAIEPRLRPLLKYIHKHPMVSTDCKLGLLKTSLALRKGEMWAFKLITATGFMPNGVYEGGFANLGSQDQCLNVESDSGIRGRYCTLFWRPPTEVSLAAFTKEELRQHPRQDIRLWLNNTRERFHVGSRSGICIPSVCQQKEMHHIVSGVASAYGAEASVRYCRLKETVRFKTLEVGIISFFGAVLIVIILSSCADLLFTKYERNQAKKRPAGPWKKLLVTYSAVSNTRKLLDVSDKGGDSQRLRFLHGMKFLSALWVILSHAYYCVHADAIDSVFRAVELTESLRFQVVANGFVCVSTFIFVSGYLLGYTLLKRRDSLRKKNAFAQIIIIIVRRYLRTTVPAMVVVLAFFLLPKLAHGPLAEEHFSKYYNGCSKNWWTVLLHINNFNKYEDICLDHFWYISVDMQIFVVASALCVLMTRHIKVGAVILSLLSIAGSGIVMAQTFYYNYQPIILFWNPDTDKSTETGEMVYSLPFVHFGSFVIGIFCGLCTLHSDRWHPSKCSRCLLWALSLCCTTVVVFASWPWNNLKLPSRGVAALYAALHKNAWALSLGWITYACATGQAGPVNTFLSWRGFVVPSRLTYSVYLIHYLVYLARVGVITVPMQLHEFLQFKDFLGVSAISYLWAYVLYLAAEAPVANLEKMLLGRRAASDDDRTAATDPQKKAGVISNASCAATCEQQSKLNITLSKTEV